MSFVFAKHVNSEKEGQYVAEALASGHLEGDGDFTRRATERLKQLTSRQHVLLTTSCTHALELMMMVSGLKPGAKVLCPSFTFSSTANAIAIRGCQPVFGDIDANTWCMGPEQVKAYVDANGPVDAIMAMPYAGVSNDLAGMQALASEYGVPLMVDAAHALFAEEDGVPQSCYGFGATLSFHRTKNISCGEGGALCLDDDEAAHFAEMIREKGTDRSAFLRGDVDKYTWRTVGSSYLPSDVLAAILLSQLEAAEAMQSRRLSVYNIYKEGLSPLAESHGILFQHVNDNVKLPAHIFGFLIPEGKTRDDRTAALKALREKGVMATSHYEPLHLAPAAGQQAPLPVTESVASRLVRLPMHAGLSDDDAAEIVAGVINVIDSLT